MLNWTFNNKKFASSPSFMAVIAIQSTLNLNHHPFHPRLNSDLMPPPPSWPPTMKCTFGQASNPTLIWTSSSSSVGKFLVKAESCGIIHSIGRKDERERHNKKSHTQFLHSTQLHQITSNYVPTSLVHCMQQDRLQMKMKEKRNLPPLLKPAAVFSKPQN